MKKETKKVVGKRKSQPKIYKKTKPIVIMGDSNSIDKISLWKIVTKRLGRPLKFETPMDLWNIACEFFQWCEDNPITEIDYRGSYALPVILSTPQPFNFNSFCLFAGLNLTYLNELEEAMNKRIEKDKNDLQAIGFSQTLTYIKEICREQKFKLALANKYNPTIASRDLGLTDKSESIVNMQGTPQIIMIDDSGNKIEIE